MTKKNTLKTRGKTTIQRAERGHFKKGHCPNPLGRKPVDKSFREWMKENSAEVLSVVHKKALMGDLRACRIWLDKCIPNVHAIQTENTSGIPENPFVVAIEEMRREEK